MEIVNSPILSDQQRASRKPRSDAQRNRDLIVQVAKEAFTEHGSGTSLDDIAKKAGVGPGTLYRHFPSREALLGAVYRAEVDKLAAAAEEYGRTLPPVEALRTWLLLFIDHLGTKKIIAAALNDLVATNQMIDENKSKNHDAVKSLFDLAIASGDIRPDINPGDFVHSIVGVAYFGASMGWQEHATRLVDILIQGSRPLP